MAAYTLTRRDLLRLGGGAGASCFLGSTMKGAEQLVTARAAVDHLLLGVSDLDRGVAEIQRTTGVKAAIHPGVGTRNALISLGGKQYLEIIAPDPTQTAYNFHIDVRTLSERG
jgi:hypothetical protein